ncbi:MAG TPA: hypothetical protein VGY54_10825 [Polyangiaceae bacterium]|nr:hypothetical protein [Polyangiaceae bacterium]
MRSAGLSLALTMAAAMGALACVGSNPSTPPNYRRGPNYSSTPCFDNCGSDAACQVNCTHSTTRYWGPAGPVMPGPAYGPR